MNKYIIIFLLLLLGGEHIYAQKVSNISFRQEQSNIVVSYNLETTNPCKIMLYVSTDGGKIWQGPLKQVIGDVGDKISSGNNSIIWEVLEEFKELSGNNIKFKIRSLDNYIETVIIGNQEWTTNNLNVSKYRNGDIIPEVKDHNKWANLTTGAWCYYNNDPKNGAIYGKLYNWYAINDPRGIAPEGFHIPSDSEWKQLINYLGGEKITPGKIKEAGTSHWNSPNYGATNSSGFTALPGGYRSDLQYNYYSTNQEFHSIGEGCDFWVNNFNIDSKNSSIVHCSHKYWEGYNGADKCIFVSGKKSGHSVRCIKD